MPRTSHSLNPVPFFLVDPRGQLRLTPGDNGLSAVAATVLTLCGVAPPEDHTPSLVASESPT